MLLNLVCHHLGAGKIILTHHNGHASAVTGQEHSLLGCGKTASQHKNIKAAEELAVTGRTVGNAASAGALVWMWISALFGLSTKYGESVLAVKYRETNSSGEMAGGPMYAMKKGFKVKWLGSLLAFLFSLFAVIASFGIGNLTQANSISDAVQNTFGVPTWITADMYLA